MEVTRESLQNQYIKMETEKLVQLSAEGTLTDLANSVLHEVLESRGISGAKLEEQKERDKNAEIAVQKDAAIKRIKNSVYALYVIAGLQCLISIGYQFWLGVGFGILLALMGFLIRSYRSTSAAIVVALLGGIVTVTNFLGPIATGGVYGSLVLSIVTIWLGFRCYKAARFLGQNESLMSG